jgi:quercetin dioxygenase-like cupin family protein
MKSPGVRRAHLKEREMNTNLRGAALRSPLLGLALVLVFGGVALATPAIDFVGTPLAKGTMAETVQFNTGVVKFQTKGPVVFNVATVTIKPGGTSGWHSHPGVVLVTVKQGSVTFYDQTCSATVHATGTSFVEAAGDGPGLAHNEGSIDAIVYVTYIAPAATTVFRIDEANPGCPES